MISFPNAKINIGLNITEKNPDGYHSLESCFYPIDWSDILEIIPSERFRFLSTGLPIPSSEENNLCVKAYRLLQKDYNIAPVSIHLHKVIPIGAGLGGGSSDGGFTLKMLHKIFDLPLSIAQLESYAIELGSDCPFFIQNKPVYATGTGNIFSEIFPNISGKHLVVIVPNICLSTAAAYAKISPNQPSSEIQNTIKHQPVSNWKSYLSNDFERSVFPNYPEIAKIKELLYKHGSLYASMTGSGASVYGIFDQPSKYSIQKRKHLEMSSMK